MNQSESERLSSALDKLGYSAVSSPDEAGLVILNSCIVRGNAENKVINKLHALKGLKRRNPGVTIALTGCLVDSDNTVLKKKFPHIDYFFKPGEYPEWLGKPQSSILPSNPGVSVYVPIIQGCDNFCSYCIVPYRRGREKSRQVAELICEVEELVRRGAKEVILLGQNVDSYGHDLPGKPGLADLLIELNRIDGLLRIRFLTSHPKDVSLKLIETVSRLDKVCRQLSLPVQAGSDKILKAMRRGYTVDDYRKLIETIRKYMPDVSLSTDVIVGFPGESDADFEETVDILAEIKFDQVHVACYSPRTGTLAAREMEDDVPLEVKKARLDRIEKLEEQIAAGLNSGLMGKTVDVLVEGEKGGRYYGRTRGDKLAFFPSRADLTGLVVHVKITHTSPWSLSGEFVSISQLEEE